MRDDLTAEDRAALRRVIQANEQLDDVELAGVFRLPRLWVQRERRRLDDYYVKKVNRFGERVDREDVTA